MDLIFLLILSWQLHKMAVAKGVSPWPYVLNFVGFFAITSFGVALIASKIVGFSGNMQDWIKVLLPLAPFILLFEVLLFIFFRMKISRLPLQKDEDDEPNRPTDNGKKDLSYFR